MEKDSPTNTSPLEKSRSKPIDLATSLEDLKRVESLALEWGNEKIPLSPKKGKKKLSSEDQTKIEKQNELLNNIKEEFLQATQKGNTKVIVYLLEEFSPKISARDKIVNFKDLKSGRTALHYSAASGNIEIVDILLKNGANIDAVDTPGDPALCSALKYNRTEVVKRLIQKNCSLYLPKQEGGRSLLHKLAAQGKLQQINEILDAKPQLIDITDNRGQTPLFSAVKYNRMDVIDFLLAREAKAGIQNTRNGRTVLHEVCASGKFEIVTKLCKHDSKLVSIKDLAGQTPLFSAMKYKHHEVITYLVEDMHAGLDVQDTKGDTPLHFAAQLGLQKVVELLIAKNARADIENSEGQLPADVATGKGLKSLLFQAATNNKRKMSGTLPISEEVKKEEMSDGTPLKKRKSTEGVTTSDKTVAYAEKADEDPKHYEDNGGDLSTMSYTQDSNNALNSRVYIQSSDNSKMEEMALASQMDPMIRAWEIPIEEIIFAETLGSGAFGVVKKATWKGSTCAVKILHKLDENSMKMFIQEINWMTKIRHVHIVQYLGACIKMPHVSLVMEYLPMNLMDVIKAGPVDLDKIVLIGRGIASGLHYLHTRVKVIHRDIKPSNILLDMSLTAKIADFGISKDNEGTSTMTQIGTPDYMAPEILQTKHYNEKVDIYSFGLVLFSMYIGNKPFYGIKIEGQEPSPLQIAIKVATEKLRPTIPSSCDSQLSKLIQESWEQNPAKRLSAEDALNELLRM